MSRHSDALKITALAEAHGFEVVKVKHGYAVMDGETVVTRIPNDGNGRKHWVRGARRALTNYSRKETP